MAIGRPGIRVGLNWCRTRPRIRSIFPRFESGQGPDHETKLLTRWNIGGPRGETHQKTFFAVAVASDYIIDAPLFTFIS